MKTSSDTVTLSRKEYDDLISVKHQLEELKRMLFGSRSERFVSTTNDEQLPLFAIPDDETTPEPATQTISYERKESGKKKPIRALLPAHLPREEEILEPEQLEDGVKKIGEEITEILEYTPGKLFVKRFVRSKYAQNQGDGVLIADLPCLPIPKGNAGAGLLAHLQISKFVDHLPFYRQVQMFKREGIKLAESTINGWFKATCQLLKPLYDCLTEQIKGQSYLQADESPIAVQSNQKPGATHTGYHWVYHAPLIKLVAFDYQPSRSRQGPEVFLEKFKGQLQTDGYTAYNKLGDKENITLFACLAHARRYFEKALDNDQKTAEHALKVIQSVYTIERNCKENELDASAIEQERKEKALPILKQWLTWLNEQQLASTPKSPIGKAVNYTLNLWPRLIRYVDYGHVLIDNNKIENLIRPLALGRKNYLFAGSHNAAQRAAMMYSFFATCKLNDVNPYTWLKDVLDKIPTTKVNNLDHLLPSNWSENH